jgi:hypothetical protein
MRSVLALMAAALLANGCVQTQQVRLDQVVTKHTYQVPKEDLMTAVRFYCQREGFRISLQEETFGKLLASRTDVGTREGDERTIIMSLKVLAIDSSRTSVDARFALAGLQGTPTQHDEALLVDCYHRLFNFLDGYF